MLRFNEFEPHYGPVVDLDEGWSAMSSATLRKYPARRELFLNKYKSEEEFILKKSPDVPVKFIYDKEIYDKIDNEDFKVVFKDSTGKTYKITDIAKTSEFGGKGSGAGTAKEDIQLKSLQDQIIAKIKKSSKAYTIINVNKTSHKIVGAASTPGVPKSDFHLIDVEGNPVVWISHKDGRSAKDYGQWGGMSKRKEPDIHNNKETQSFITDLKKEFPDGLPRKTTIYRKMKKDLQMMAVYGNGYSGSLGIQNVSIVLQGPVTLKGSKLSANHVHENGETITGDYEPVFMAMYKGPDRNDFGVKKTRVVISPLGGRKKIETEFIPKNFVAIKKILGNK